MTTTDERLEAIPLPEFSGKKVKIRYFPRGLAEGERTDEKIQTLEGTCEAANVIAVVIRPRGKTLGELIETNDIVEIGLDDSKPKPLAQKSLKNPSFDTVRAHLADRHGWTLKDVNELGEEEAMRAHRDLDHAELSHTHPYIEDAESEADGEEPDDEELLGDEDEDEDED